MHAGKNRALLGQVMAHEPVLVAMRAHAGVAAVQEEAMKVESTAMVRMEEEEVATEVMEVKVAAPVV